MKVRTRMGISVLAVLLALSMAIYAAALPSVPEVSAHNNPPSAEATIISQQEISPGFILRDCGGYIGVYRNENPGLLIDLTAIEVETLRKVDRDLLHQGIYCRTERELYSLLEDFGS